MQHSSQISTPILTGFGLRIIKDKSMNVSTLRIVSDITLKLDLSLCYGWFKVFIIAFVHEVFRKRLFNVGATGVSNTRTQILISREDDKVVSASKLAHALTLQRRTEVIMLTTWEKAQFPGDSCLEAR